MKFAPFQLLCLTAIIVVFLIARPSLADSRDAELEEMKAMMQDMAQTIRTLQAEVSELRKDQVNAKQTKTATGNAATGVARTILPPAAAELTDPVPGVSQRRDRKSFLVESTPQVNNAPINPSLTGFIPIPGTSTIFQIGGSVRLDVIADNSNNGNPNEFVPSSFPVPGEPGAGRPSRTQVHAKGSRITFELRPIMGHDNNLRVYYENDFFGDASTSAPTYRLRHLYGQAWNFLIGQTFSNFMDVDAFPGVIDYEGPNGLVNIRQPQVRYSQPFLDTKLQLAVSLEQPNAQIRLTDPAYSSGASTVNRIPDFAAHVRYEDKRFGHLQFSGIYRYLSYDNSNTGQGVLGWGISLSCGLSLFAHDALTVQGTYGEGIARYVRDPSGANEDAALDSHGNLRGLPVWGVVAGYTHAWADKWKSTVSYGYAHVDTEASNGQFAFDHSNYVSGNLIYQWSPSVRFGVEYLYGTKEVRNGASHDGQRLNFVVKYDLVN
jgi:outer membrane DcaP-like protein